MSRDFERSEGVSYANIWKKKSLRSRMNSNCKSPEAKGTWGIGGKAKRSVSQVGIPSKQFLRG